MLKTDDCVTANLFLYTLQYVNLSILRDWQNNFGPFDRKRVFGVICGNLDVYVPNYTLVFNTSLAKNPC